MESGGGRGDGLGAGFGGVGESAQDGGAFAQVAPEGEFPVGDVLQAAQVFVEQRVVGVGKGIDHPLCNAAVIDQAKCFHVAELFGDFHLVLFEDFHQVTDAERSGAEQVEDAQALGVAEAFVDFDIFHGWNMQEMSCGVKGRVCRAWTGAGVVR
jgi:hypothetical protein